MRELKDFEIRKAEIADAAAIASVNINSWKATYQGVIKQDFLDSLEVEAKIPGAMKRVQREDLDCFVAVDTSTNKVIGFADFGPCREKNIDADAELYAIYLDLAAKGHGVGKALFAKGYEATQARGYKKMMVSVFDQNPDAKKFYEKMGGKHAGFDHVNLGETRYLTATYIWNFG